MLIVSLSSYEALFRPIIASHTPDDGFSFCPLAHDGVGTGIGEGPPVEVVGGAVTPPVVGGLDIGGEVPLFTGPGIDAGGDVLGNGNGTGVTSGMFDVVPGVSGLGRVVGGVTTPGPGIEPEASPGDIVPVPVPPPLPVVGVGTAVPGGTSGVVELGVPVLSSTIDEDCPAGVRFDGVLNCA